MASSTPIGEPEAKRARIEGEAPVPPVVPAAPVPPATPEPPKELEENAPVDKRKPLDQQVRFYTNETTMNVVQTMQGQVLAPLTDGGLQYLLAGARANVGVLNGRYLYEAKIIESHNPQEPMQARGNRGPQPRQMLRVGFSLPGTSLFLGETEESVCFDSEGIFTAEKKKSATSQRFVQGQVLSILLNLDKKSPNANTVSLFRDGVRVSPPNPLPECLKGKPLFPTVTFRNMTVQVNFGKGLLASLPFVCRSLQEAAKDDVQVTPAPPVGKDGKHEVLFPVGLPDEGTFDWLDGFLAENPHYVELSDRKIVEWAVKSGLFRPKATSWKNSNDKPDFNFGIQLMDDFSIRRIMHAVVATQPRNYIVMEVKSNLMKDERAEAIGRFSSRHYKRVGMVVMGEPKDDFKKRSQELFLKEKHEKAMLDWQQRKLEKQRKKQLEDRQKQLDDANKEVEDEQNRAAAAEKPKEETKAGEEVKKEGEDKKPEGGDVEMKTGEANAEAKDEAKEEAKEEVKEEDEMKVDEEADEPEPVAELTDEEKAQWFRKKEVTDLTGWVLGTSFSKFTAPSDEEGFDELRYAWQGKEQCVDYLAKWILKNKILCRIEDLQPGEWFKSKYPEFQKILEAWETKQNEPRTKTPKPDAKLAEGADGEKKEGEGEGEKPKTEENKGEDGEEVPDIFAVENVLDTGKGDPLFRDFEYEDWQLVALRVELHLLVHAFAKDAGDPERVGIHESHLPFYYNKYFRKMFNTKFFGVESNKDLIELVKDSVTLAEGGVLKAEHSEDRENYDLFLKLAEQCRRDRQRRIDAGDDNARLKFTKPEASGPPPPGPPRTPQAPRPPSSYSGGQKGGYPPRPQQPPQAQSWSGANKGGPSGYYNKGQQNFGKGGYAAPPPAAQSGSRYAGGGCYGKGGYGKGYGK